MDRMEATQHDFLDAQRRWSADQDRDFELLEVCTDAEQQEMLIENKLLSKIIKFADGTDARTRKYRATLAWYQEQLRARGVIITDKQFKDGLSVYMAIHGMFSAGIVEYLKQEGVLQADVVYSAKEWVLEN
jgi:energy-converting hydrogenase Eha subunit H